MESPTRLPSLRAKRFFNTRLERNGSSSLPDHNKVHQLCAACCATIRTSPCSFRASVASLYFFRMPFLRIHITAQTVPLRNPRPSTPICTRHDTCLPMLVSFRLLVGDKQLSILAVASRLVAGDLDNGEPACGSVAFAEDAIHLLKG